MILLDVLVLVFCFFLSILMLELLPFYTCSISVSLPFPFLEVCLPISFRSGYI